MTTRWILPALALLLLTACPASPPPPASEEVKPAANEPAAKKPAPDPCRGAALALNELDERCLVDKADSDLQPDGLAASVAPSPVQLTSGGQVKVAIRFTNTLTTPLPVTLSRDCLIYEAEIQDSEGKPADMEGEMPMVGGLCAALKPVRVTLEPKGHIDVMVPVSSVKKRWVMQGDQAVVTPGGPIPAGKYTVQFRSPYNDPNKGPNDDRSLWIKAPLEITPRP